MTFWKTLLKVVNHVVSFGCNLIGIPTSVDGLERIESSVYHGKFGEIPKQLVNTFLPELSSGNPADILKSLTTKLGGLVCDAAGIPIPHQILEKVADIVIPSQKKLKKEEKKEITKSTKYEKRQTNPKHRVRPDYVPIRALQLCHQAIYNLAACA